MKAELLIRLIMNNDEVICRTDDTITRIEYRNEAGNIITDLVDVDDTTIMSISCLPDTERPSYVFPGVLTISDPRHKFDNVKLQIGDIITNLLIQNAMLSIISNSDDDIVHISYHRVGTDRTYPLTHKQQELQRCMCDSMAGITKEAWVAFLNNSED